MKKQCIAMILAGGQGSRLGILTKNLAKPAVPFGGKYRIIDFSLSNCTNSGIDTVGVLTQYNPLVLNAAIGIGAHWDLDRKNGGVSLLPPYVKSQGGEWYKGTANAIYQNMEFINKYSPEYVLVLSGDHIYKMDYSKMLDFHKEKKADVTIAVLEVDWDDASRFGIMNTDEQGSIVEFAEKPENPKSNLASMGIYIFNWDKLQEYLIKDEANPHSNNDFGKNVIPMMLADGLKMYAYAFDGYWKDVGTISSFWEANMDLLAEQPIFDIHNPHWPIYCVNADHPAQYIGPEAVVKRTIVNDGCQIFGEVEHSVLFPGVIIAKGAKVKDAILMPNVHVGENALVTRTIIGEETVIGPHCEINGENLIDAEVGELDMSGIMVVEDRTVVEKEGV